FRPGRFMIAGIAMRRFVADACRTQQHIAAFFARIEHACDALRTRDFLEEQSAVAMRDAAVEPTIDDVRREATQLDGAAAPFSGYSIASLTNPVAGFLQKRGNQFPLS
ncbi:MAG: hypothetical protein ABSF34_11870, partial [Verrucomicrobiota bacterium]